MTDLKLSGCFLATYLCDLLIRMKKVMMNYKKHLKLSSVIFLFITIAMFLYDDSYSKTDRKKDNWAQSIKLDGVPNLHKVTENLYRSAQPSAKGIKELKKLGIKTVVNLRSFHSDKDEIGNIGLIYEHIYMKAWHPENKEIIQFLRIVTDKNKTPVLVHCQHGADRTGTMCAIYRIIVCGWTKDGAIQEMIQGGFGFHGVWDNLIKYIKDLDVEKIKQQLKLNNK